MFMLLLTPWLACASRDWEFIDIKASCPMRPVVGFSALPDLMGIVGGLGAYPICCYLEACMLVLWGSAHDWVL